jgi:hypothetical protein
MAVNAPAIPYKVLKQTHPEYDAVRLQQIEDLYEGGWAIMRKAEAYLPKLAMEHPEQYSTRCSTSSYQPYFGQILDQFVADLFTQPLSVLPAGDKDNPNTPGKAPADDFYTDLAKDMDGEGTGLEELASDVLTTALKHRRAYVMVDAPKVDGPAPASLADEDATGANRFYAYEVPPGQVIDWRIDKDTGVFAWVILATRDQERMAPTGSRDTVRESYTIWSANDGGNASWVRYDVSYDPNNKPNEDDLIAPADTGDTSFKRIPLLTFEIPKGLWVGNKIGPQALEHWRRRSSLIGAENRSCVAIPWVALGPEMPSMGESNSEAQEDPNRGRDPVRQFEQRGFLALGHQDKLEFAEPKGHAYEIIDKQCEGLKEAMFSVNHQMAASIKPTGAALGRSGLSKQKDEDKTSKVLGAMGRVVRTFATDVYDVISKARGETIVWVAHGLDTYEHDDREQVLEESLQLQAVNIPSATFRKEHAKRVAGKLVPNLPPATVAQINDEIDSGVDDDEEIRDLKKDAEKDAIVNPPPPVAPGAGTVTVTGKPVPGKPPPKPQAAASA